METKTKKSKMKGDAEQQTIESLTKHIEVLEKRINEVNEIDEAKEEQERQDTIDFIGGRLGTVIGATLQLSDGGDWLTWSRFRSMLFSNFHINPFFKDRDFINGLALLNLVIDRLIFLHTAETPKDVKDGEFGHVNPHADGGNLFFSRMVDSIPAIIMGASSAADAPHEYDTRTAHDAFTKLKKAFDLLPLEMFKGYDYVELKVYLDTILFCQTSLMSYQQK